MFSTPETSRSWSVTEVNVYLKSLMEADTNLQNLWVEGEISNLSRPASGHLYFTLKDSTSSIRCVMWKNRAQAVNFVIQDGVAVTAHGGLSVYEQRGQYQLYVDALRPRGEGALFQEFQRLKTQLEAEGLFDAERKRPIPVWPKRVGVVTSASGAAYHDMEKTLYRRYPLVEILLEPTSVQGESAPGEMIQALKRLYEIKPDLILIGRGGGSIEDLWAFNDESLARVLAESPVPVISGVGHETDFTITDFVADLRAPTPTAAAELAVPDQIELRQVVSELRKRLERAVSVSLAEGWRQSENLAGQIERLSPLSEINDGRQRVDELLGRSGRGIAGRLKSARESCFAFEARLASLNPEAILKRGYAILTGEDGAAVYQVGQTSSGEKLQVRVSDGAFEVIVS
jgi:exodeoxyribonuclease VII large subunit